MNVLFEPRRCNGRRVAAACMVDDWREYDWPAFCQPRGDQGFLREQGNADPDFRDIQAAHLALAGEREEPLMALTEAIDLGYRDPLLGLDPAFAGLHDNPAFQAQVIRNLDLINTERARLGMGPLQ